MFDVSEKKNKKTKRKTSAVFSGFCTLQTSTDLKKRKKDGNVKLLTNFI